MKISELSHKCHVSQSAIRYYIKNGLLLPDSTNSQYVFSNRELADLRQIIKMKQHNFTLKEIQDYFSLLRHSSVREQETINACLSLLNKKRDELYQQAESVQAAIQDIEQEIEDMNSCVFLSAQPTGVPLCALPLLVCPVCGKTLRIEHAVIQEGFVLSGDLKCPSSDHVYNAMIDNGIVKTNNLYTAPYDHPDLNRGMYRDMKPDFSGYLVKCYDFIGGTLQEQDLHGKVIMEANINGYFYLYHHLHLLPEDCICIVIDKYPEMLEMYKALIEQVGLQRNILYIADASMNYPLRPECVDIHISYFGENEHQLYHQRSYLLDAQEYFRKDVLILGSLLSYKKNSPSRVKLRKKYPESNEHCYQVDYLRRDYADANYSIEMVEVGTVMNTGEKRYAFDCHVAGDPLSIYHFQAQRTR